MNKFLKNTKNQLRCYGDHHSCYGLRRTFGSVTTKIYESYLSKNVYKTEIDEVQPKLWRFTLGTLILGHPVYIYILSDKQTGLCLSISITIYKYKYNIPEIMGSNNANSNSNNSSGRRLRL